MRNVLLFGASGGLATELAKQSLAAGAEVTLVTRRRRKEEVEKSFAAEIENGRACLHLVDECYVEYDPSADPHAPYDTVLFTQALFMPTPLTEMTEERIEDEIAVGLTEQIELTRRLVRAHPVNAETRLDFGFTGSTSAFDGFALTTVYCAVKHGLLGFVRAMNAEYAQTSTRFWLFSMGSMDTEMGHNVPKQDRMTFLQAPDVARRIIACLADPSNMFEPEVLIRRRILRKTN